MIRIENIKAPPGFDQEFIEAEAARRLGLRRAGILSVKLLKKSLDARRRTDIHYVLAIGVEVEAPDLILKRLTGDASVRFMPDEREREIPSYRGALPPVIVGSGPAGLFAALTLAHAGARPILLERGGRVDERQQTVERFWAGGPLDPDCNVQFGEGGAGTFSDGKLTTGTKDPRIRDVLQTFQQFGAPEEILYEAKPHIGTDRLRETVKNMRNAIIALGGEILFHARFTDFQKNTDGISRILYEQNGQRHTLETRTLILAAGHSARDVFQLLFDRSVPLAQKAFSVGVRIEHLQKDISAAMYGERWASLPPADYKLAVHLDSGRSLYTFCMCPGGYVVAGASEPGGIVTNGMSNHARDGQNANSALLVGIGPEDFGSDHPLAGVRFQREIEQRAYALSGSFTAPSAPVGSFLDQSEPGAFGSVSPSYRPGTRLIPPDAYLPPFVCAALRSGLRLMGRKIHGFDSPDAVLTGPETRSSSPVRILRGQDGCSIGLPGLYPCGEGAGYAGGITSAAVDGIRVAELVIARFGQSAH